MHSLPGFLVTHMQVELMWQALGLFGHGSYCSISGQIATKLYANDLAKHVGHAHQYLQVCSWQYGMLP